MVRTSRGRLVTIAKDVAQGNQISNVLRPLRKHYVFFGQRFLEKLSDLFLAESLHDLLLLDSLEVVRDLGD